MGALILWARGPGSRFESEVPMSVISALRKKGVGLALGGGAARGFAHIGVLKVLQEEGIPITAVAGTSAGSVIGAALCAGFSWSEILEKARAFDWSELASLKFPRMGMMSLTRLERVLDRILGGKSFDQLSIPFAAIAVDLVSGSELVIREGSVAAAVQASCSIPGIFEPTIRDGRILVDGGLRNDVPADVARAMGARFVIGVNLNSAAGHSQAPRNILDVIHYSFDILLKHSSQGGLADADLVIRPSLGDIGYRELKKIDDLVARGENAARAAVQRLKELRRLQRAKSKT
jgi:NTE family protein